VPGQSEVNRLAIAVTEDNPEYVYMVAGSEENSGFYGLYRSTNSGVSFELRSNTPNILTYSEIGQGEGGQSWYDLAIAADHSDADNIFVGGINVWKSENGGLTWDITSHWVYPSDIGYTHADIHSLDFYGNRLYCGSDGGVFQSIDQGDNWTDLSEGLQISQYYRIAVSTSDSSLILTASQDNGTNIFEDGDYLHLLGGDGNAAAIDYNNDNIMYSAYPGGNFQRSINGGASFDAFSDNIDESGAWVTPFEFHPNNPEIIFAAYENVWRYSGGSWTQISDFSISGTLRALGIAPSDGNVIYTASFGTILKTTNGGNNWSNISGGLPDNFITDIEVHPNNPDELWVTMSGYDEAEKVFYSDDGGSSWNNESLNLPNLPVNCINYQLGSNDGLYIGTDVGIYYKDAESLNWTGFSEGLPNVIVNQIVFHYGSSTVYAGTYGRGVWSNDFFDSGAVLPVANFNAEDRLICAGDSISYINQSLNISDSVLWTFDGGTPSQTTEINPTITYSDEGIYNATLVVQNENGSDSLTFENYVEVLNQTGIPSPYQEDFENAQTLNEVQMYVDGEELNTWQLNTEVGLESSGSAWINNHLNTTSSSKHLESAPIDLSQMDTALVSFRVAYAQKPNSDLEILKVYMSNDCGETWNFKKTIPSFEMSETLLAPRCIAAIPRFSLRKSGRNICCRHVGTSSQGIPSARSIPKSLQGRLGR
jgi:PKD repeat protein